MLIQKAMHDTGMPPTRAEIARTLKFRSANAAEDNCGPSKRKRVLSFCPALRAAFDSRIHCVSNSGCLSSDALRPVKHLGARAIEAHYK